MLGKIEGSKKRGRPNTRWIESINKATGVSLQDLGGAFEDTVNTTHSQSNQGSKLTQRHIIHRPPSHKAAFLKIYSQDTYVTVCMLF